MRALEAGQTNPRPAIRVEHETPVIARIDGDLGFGQVVARRGIALATEKAKAQGLSAVTLRRTNHVGRLADYAETAASAHEGGPMLEVVAMKDIDAAQRGGERDSDKGLRVAYVRA